LAGAASTTGIGGEIDLTAGAGAGVSAGGQLVVVQQGKVVMSISMLVLLVPHLVLVVP